MSAESQIASLLKSSGKLVYGIMPKNLLDGCKDACRGSVVDSTDSAGKVFVDPFANSTFYWLKPFMAAQAQPVDAKFLIDHGVSEEIAVGFIVESNYPEGIATPYWLSMN